MSLTQEFLAWTKAAAVVLGSVCVSGCSSAATIHDAFDADLVLAGRVISSEDVGIQYSGDAFGFHSIYRFRPLNQPESEIELIGSGKCPLRAAGDQVYLVVLNKRRPVPGTPREYANLMEVVACVFIDDKNSIGVLEKLHDF